MKNKLVLNQPNDSSVTVTEDDGTIYIRVNGLLKLTLSLTNSNRLLINTRFSPNISDPVEIIGGPYYNL